MQTSPIRVASRYLLAARYFTPAIDRSTPANRVIRDVAKALKQHKDVRVGRWRILGNQGVYALEKAPDTPDNRAGVKDGPWRETTQMTTDADLAADMLVKQWLKDW